MKDNNCLYLNDDITVKEYIENEKKTTLLSGFVQERKNDLFSSIKTNKINNKQFIKDHSYVLEYGLILDDLFLTNIQILFSFNNIEELKIKHSYDKGIEIDSVKNDLLLLRNATTEALNKEPVNTYYIPEDIVRPYFYKYAKQSLMEEEING